MLHCAFPYLPYNERSSWWQTPTAALSWETCKWTICALCSSTLVNKTVFFTLKSIFTHSCSTFFVFVMFSSIVAFFFPTFLPFNHTLTHQLKHWGECGVQCVSPKATSTRDQMGRESNHQPTGKWQAVPSNPQLLSNKHINNKDLLIIYDMLIAVFIF